MIGRSTSLALFNQNIILASINAGVENSYETAKDALRAFAQTNNEFNPWITDLYLPVSRLGVFAAFLQFILNSSSVSPAASQSCANLSGFALRAFAQTNNEFATPALKSSLETIISQIDIDKANEDLPYIVNGDVPENLAETLEFAYNFVMFARQDNVKK